MGFRRGYLFDKHLECGLRYVWILLAWGAGAIRSPFLIARLRHTTGRYDQAIYSVAVLVLMLIAIVLPLLVRPAPPAPLRYAPGSRTPPYDMRRPA